MKNAALASLRQSLQKPTFTKELVMEALEDLQDAAVDLGAAEARATPPANLQALEESYNRASETMWWVLDQLVP